MVLFLFCENLRGFLRNECTKIHFKEFSFFKNFIATRNNTLIHSSRRFKIRFQCGFDIFLFNWRSLSVILGWIHAPDVFSMFIKKTKKEPILLKRLFLLQVCYQHILQIITQIINDSILETFFILSKHVTIFLEKYFNEKLSQGNSTARWRYVLAKNMSREYISNFTTTWYLIPFKAIRSNANAVRGIRRSRRIK